MRNMGFTALRMQCESCPCFYSFFPPSCSALPAGHFLLVFSKASDFGAMVIAHNQSKVAAVLGSPD